MKRPDVVPVHGHHGPLEVPSPEYREDVCAHALRAVRSQPRAQPLDDLDRLLLLLVFLRRQLRALGAVPG